MGPSPQLRGIKLIPQGGEAREWGITSQSGGPVLLWPHTAARHAHAALCRGQCLPGLAVWRLCSTSMVGDSTGCLQEKQGSGAEAEEKLGGSEQDAPSRGTELKGHAWSSHTGSGCGNPSSVFSLLRARTMPTHGASCGGWSYPPGKGSDVKSQEGGGGLS